MAKLTTGIRQVDFKKYFKYDSDEEIYLVDTKQLLEMMLCDAGDTNMVYEFQQLLMKYYNITAKESCEGVDVKFLSQLVKTWLGNQDLYKSENLVCKAFLEVLNDNSGRNSCW
jgi:hypothetical protein